MARLIYSTIASLDGYVEDDRGAFEWAEPDEEVLAFVNELERPIGTYLYGRRMYETMVYWETAGADLGLSEAAEEFGKIWRAAQKIVYSWTLETVSSARTRLEHEFDPAAVRRLKESSPRDLTVGGSELAGLAMAAGLVDQCHLLLHPLLVGAGKKALPDGLKGRLELLGERRFQCGLVHLHYAFVDR